MKKLIFLFFLAVSFHSMGQFALTGTKNRWGNGFGFSSKSDAQLAQFAASSDSILMQIGRVLQRPVFRFNVADPWNTIAYLTDIPAGANLWKDSSGFFVPNTGYGNYGLRVTGAGSFGSLTAANSITATTISGTLQTAAQPNITSLGTLANLTVSGNATINAISTTGITKAGGLSTVFFATDGTAQSIIIPAGANLWKDSSGFFVPSAGYGNYGLRVTGAGSFGSLTVANTVTAGSVSASLLTGTLQTASQPNITTVGTLGALTVTGSSRAGTFYGAGTGLNGTAPALSAGSAAVLVNGHTIGMTGDVSYTSASFNGSADVSGTSTLATVNSNVGTFGSAVQVPQFVVNGKGLITSVSNLTIAPSASSITNGQALTKADDTNVTLTLGGTPATSLLQATSITAGWTGNLSVARGGFGNTTGTLTTASQPNVTLVGTLSNLTVTGNVTSNTLSVNTSASIASGLTVGTLAYVNTLGYFTDGGYENYWTGTGVGTGKDMLVKIGTFERMRFASNNSTYTASFGNTQGNSQSFRIFASTASAGIVRLSAYTNGTNAYGALALNTGGAGVDPLTINADQTITLGSSSPITGPSFIKSGGTSSQFLMADGSVTSLTGALSASVFTPTFSASVNCTPSQINGWTYQQIGNVVTVYGYVSVSITLPATLSTFEVSLPIASNFASSRDVVGNGMGSLAGLLNSFLVAADANTTTDKVVVAFLPPASGMGDIRFSFQYRIL